MDGQTVPRGAKATEGMKMVPMRGMRLAALILLTGVGAADAQAPATGAASPLPGGGTTRDLMMPGAGGVAGTGLGGSTGGAGDAGAPGTGNSVKGPAGQGIDGRGIGPRGGAVR